MIRVIVQTEVGSPMRQVQAAFNEQLLKKLNPPFPVARLRKYEGEQPGAAVWIELDFLLFRQLWKSRIVARAESAAFLSFTDEGEQLPFFLRSWEHEHRLEALPAGRTRITDRLTFTTPWWLPNWLAQPVFKGLMMYRQPIYRRVFGG